MRAVAFRITLLLPFALILAANIGGGDLSGSTNQASMAAPAGRPRAPETGLPPRSPIDNALASTDRLTDAERQMSILEARSELENKAYARLEVLLGAFGALITILVVGFGIATYRSAANAARAELANIKDRVEELRLEAERATGKSVEAARSADESAASAKASAEQAHTHELSAQEDSAKIREVAALAERQIPSSSNEAPEPLSAAERATVADAAREVTEKPEREWTADDFKVKILEAQGRAEWEEVQRLARGMSFLFGDAAELQGFALFAEARAIEEAGKIERPISAYDEVARRLSELDSPKVERVIARAMVNRGILLGNTRSHKASIQAAQDVIDRFGDSSDKTVQRLVAKAMVSRGVALMYDDKQEEAESTFQEVIEKFDQTDVAESEVAFAFYNSVITTTFLGTIKGGYDKIVVFLDKYSDSDNKEIVNLVTDAWYFKAQAAAGLGRVKTCIGALEAWKLRRGSFDCEEVQKSTLIHQIKDRPMFRKYLAQEGCVI